jgi:hypothetical protein
MTDREIAAIGRRLLRPYRIPAECPYLSEDQRELSALDLKERSEWMGEWLMLAVAAESCRLLKMPSSSVTKRTGTTVVKYPPVGHRVPRGQP